jgi:hypothetical protein
MPILLLTVALMAICMAAMAVGMIFAGKPLHGSCGGPDSDDCVCEIEKRQACVAQKRMMERLAAHRRAKDPSSCSD